MGAVGINFGAATSGTGFDVTTTVASIVANLQQVETPWNTQLTALKADDTALTSIGTDLSSLSTSLNALNDFEGVMTEKQGSSSDTNVAYSHQRRRNRHRRQPHGRRQPACTNRFRLLRSYRRKRRYQRRAHHKSWYRTGNHRPRNQRNKRYTRHLCRCHKLCGNRSYSQRNLRHFRLTPLAGQRHKRIQRSADSHAGRHHHGRLRAY